jgi:hypothetical protein
MTRSASRSQAVGPGVDACECHSRGAQTRLGRVPAAAFRVLLYRISPRTVSYSRGWPAGAGLATRPGRCGSHAMVVPGSDCTISVGYGAWQD